MATTALEIRVFAEFPLDPADYSGEWNWVHCLTFPLDTLNNLHFARKPYKWIRYATGVVVGAEGHLSLNRDLPDDVMEYNHDQLSGPADLYYHTSITEKQRMFPVDPDIGHTTVTGSDASSRRVDFCDDVATRDGKCILTGFGEHNCDAAHLLPHSKGDKYIKNFTEHRSRDAGGNDIVVEIDSVRNGVLLNRIAYANLGQKFAFLMTPNFAMSTADIDPTAPPLVTRCTAHLFVPNNPEHFGSETLNSGSPVRMPRETKDWPPNVLFDAVYASLVLAHFSPQMMKDTLGRWKSTSYLMSAAQASHEAIIDEKNARADRKKKQSESRDQRAARRADRANHRGNPDRGDYFDYLMVMPYIMMAPDKVQATRKEAEKKKAEKERSHLNDTVTSWTRGVVSAWP